MVRGTSREKAKRKGAGAVSHPNAVQQRFAPLRLVPCGEELGNQSGGAFVGSAPGPASRDKGVWLRTHVQSLVTRTTGR